MLSGFGSLKNTRSLSRPSVGKVPKTRPRRKRRRLLTGVSKQRRAANARERQRIHGVNGAFQELKSVIPVVQPESVSKMETLQLAAKWIAYLSVLLLQHEVGSACQAACGCVAATGTERLQQLRAYELEDFVLVHLDSSLQPSVITASPQPPSSTLQVSDQ